MTRMSGCSGERLRAALAGVGIYLSCEILPEIREFERASTTAVCAYVGKLLAAYLDRLQTAASGLGLPPLYVMGSSGGMVDVAEALRMPAMAVESGPAAGVVAAQLAGAQLGLAQSDFVRHGRHDGEGEPDRRRRDHGNSRIRGRRRAGESAGCRVPGTRCGCRSSTSPRSAPAAAASPGSIPAAR